MAISYLEKLVIVCKGLLIYEEFKKLKLKKNENNNGNVKKLK